MKKQKLQSNPPSRITRSTPTRSPSKPATRRRETTAKKVTAVTDQFSSTTLPAFSLEAASLEPRSAPSSTAMPSTVVPAMGMPSTEHRGESARGSEPPPSVRKLDATAAANYRRAYVSARVMNADGRFRLDEARFAQSLADLRVDPLIEQDLYTWALLAAADGDAALFAEEMFERRSA